MSVTVLVHLDFTDAGRAMWWAEAPEFPGFSAADDSLARLRLISDQAIRDILEERGEDAAAVEVEYRLVPVPASEGVPVEVQVEGGATPPAVGPRIEQVAEQVA